MHDCRVADLFPVSEPLQSKADLPAELSALTVSPTDNIGASADSANGRTVTGVLASRATSRDIKIVSFSMGLAGQELIQDCNIEITIGRRYGLVGQNGCGKTNFLQVLANREVSVSQLCRFAVRPCISFCHCRRMLRCRQLVAQGPLSPQRLFFSQVPIPDHLDLYHLSEEVAPTDRTALETVMSYSGCAVNHVPHSFTESTWLGNLGAAVTANTRLLLLQVVDYIKLEIERLNKLEEYILTEIGPEDERLMVSSAYVSVAAVACSVTAVSGCGVPPCALCPPPNRRASATSCVPCAVASTCTTSHGCRTSTSVWTSWILPLSRRTPPSCCMAWASMRR